MDLLKKILFFLFLSLWSGLLFAQTEEDDPAASSEDPNVQVLYTRYKTFMVTAHTHGFGIGARWASGTSYYNKKTYEINILSMNTPKKIKTESLGGEGNPFVYGRLNNLYMIRLGMGLNKILNNKPYSGGVQVACNFSGGFNLGLAKPNYLYIIYPDNSQGYRLQLEKYDPEKHFMDNIYGGGPYLSGFSHLRPYPGLYGKAALTFEFGEYHEKIRALEVGTTADFYFQGIPMMAFNKYPHGFFNLYISFIIGQKYN